MEPTCWWGDRLLADHCEWGEVLCTEMLQQWVGMSGGWRGCIFTGGPSPSRWHTGEDSEKVRGLTWQVSGGECSSYKEQLCKGPTAGWCPVCFRDKETGQRLTHTHTHRYRYTHIHTQIHTEIYTHTDRHTHTHTHRYTHAYTCIHAHIHTCTNAPAEIHTCTHIHTHGHLQAYIHTRKEMGHRLTHTQTHTHTAQPGARLRGSACPPPGHTRPGEPAHLKHDPGFLEQVLGGYGTRDHAPGWAGTVRGRGCAWHSAHRPCGFLYQPTHPSRKISTNFPKRLELSFLTVLALPKDSRRGVASRI